MNAIGVIPARMGSTRFPGKPLASLCGRPMIEHVWRRTAMCESLDETVVATCDDDIAAACGAFGARPVMTSASHQRASDRAAEVAERTDAQYVVMVQGDEPMITPGMVAAALEPLLRSPSVVCTNLMARITDLGDFEDRNTIKVVMGGDQRALYFSRQPIPSGARAAFASLAAYKQVCVIGFRRDFLLRFSRLEPTPLEVAESIDMLRALEHGFPVHLVETVERTQAVDTPDDLARVEALMSAAARADDPAPRPE
jgi:3-deoxy-manno-octulosonate cytidylyltransferase (CMP-KDO synthetase)